MKRLAEILAAYERLDDVIDRGTGGSGQPSARKIPNDQAYFLLCWGQLEQEVDETCRDAIRRRRASTDWQVRRGWDLYNPEDRRLSGLSFEDRTALVLDRRGGPGSPYAKVMAAYELRNRIAHGRLEDRRIDVVAVVESFYLIQAALHRSP